MPIDWAGTRWESRRGRDGADHAALVTRFRVAGYDIDVAGIVNNAVYIRWLEDLRTLWMARWLSFEDCIARGISPVLVRIEIDYRVPLRFGDVVEGKVWATSRARASALIESEFVGDGGRVYAHSIQTIAFVDVVRGRPIRLPDEFRVAMAGAVSA